MSAARALAALALLSVACSSPAPPRRAADAGSEPRATASRLVIPGEFEPVSDLVIGWDDGLAAFFLDVLAATWDEARITLVLDPEQPFEPIAAELELRGFDPSRLSVVTVPIESVWLRDFGPLTLRTAAGERRIVDFEYFGGADDDLLLERLSGRLWPRWERVSVPLELEGGNLLSDGTGRCVTSDTALEYNPSIDELGLRALMKQQFGCEVLIIAPSLAGESTGHVDMYITLTGPGEAIVGTYDRELDPDNADLADRATEMLRAHGFSVRRVPMPDNADGKYRSYTNALAVNGVVLVPVYQEDARHDDEALAVFRAAYPGRTVIPIISSEIIELSGAVHCAAMTISGS